MKKEELFYTYCTGTATPEERERVDNLVAESAPDADELTLVGEAVRLERQIRELESCDTAGAFRRLVGTIERRRRVAGIRHRAVRIAAMLALPLLIATAILGGLLSRRMNAEPLSASVTVAPGTICRFELPDRSVVWLNAGATLRYPTTFKGDSREVTLTGEGYFEVCADKAHPFVVATIHGVKVAAHGTRFNVEIGDSLVRTTLAQGCVSLLTERGGKVRMNRGETAVFDQRTRAIVVGQSNLDEVLAWKDGKIIFKGATLSEVFRRLSHRYNVDIVLHDEHRLSDQYSARVTFSDETIQQIFTYLAAAAPLQWHLSTPTQTADSSLTRQRIDVWLTKKPN